MSGSRRLAKSVRLRWAALWPPFVAVARAAVNFRAGNFDLRKFAPKLPACVFRYAWENTPYITKILTEELCSRMGGTLFGPYKLVETTTSAMLRRNSSLKCLPQDFDPKQAFYFDGLRHAYEIADLALSRLRETLTDLARNCSSGVADDAKYTSAFLDAWAFIDSVHRFRALWAKVPPSSPETKINGKSPFDELTSELVLLRNVSDHLVGKSEHLISKKGNALGVLRWITILEGEPTKGFTCMLRPGWFTGGNLKLLDPEEVDLFDGHPTSAIELSAGKHSTLLTNVYPEVEARIRHIESICEAELKITGRSGSADALVVAEFTARLKPPEGTD